MPADIGVKGGTVYDGSGAPGQVADVAIADGMIQAIGPNLSGTRELDATGCAVAPGFIDIHTHYDAQVFWDPALRPSSYHGVTTVVAGNCGFTIAPTRPDHHDVIVHTLENVEDMDPATLAAGAAGQIGRPFTYPLFAAPGGRHLEPVQLHEKGLANGAQVWPQVTPRPLTMQFTMADAYSLNTGTVFGELMKVSLPVRLAAYRDPEWRALAAANLELSPMKPRWGTFEVSESERFPELQGRR